MSSFEEKCSSIAILFLVTAALVGLIGCLLILVKELT